MTDKTKSKSAFTLAEVLITLVIIGVVAALTIPTAINKYKDEVLKSQFKKAYSTVVQALNKTETNDFYGYARCYYRYNSTTGMNTSAFIGDDCGAFYNAFAKNLNVQKTCKGNSLSNGCIPVYVSYGTQANGCYGFEEYYINNVSHSYVLANGQIIILYANLVSMFLLDINGHKGPNAYGKDLFGFTIKKDDFTQNVRLIPDVCGMTPVSGGRTTTQMIKYSISGGN